MVALKFNGCMLIDLLRKDERSTNFHFDVSDIWELPYLLNRFISQALIVISLLLRSWERHRLYSCI